MYSAFPSKLLCTFFSLIFAFNFATSAHAIGDFGPDTCMEGFVWREACGLSDRVCVTLSSRQQAKNDNAAATVRKEPAGGAYGPDTCKQGFVWREACGSNDHVCVPSTTRAVAQVDNRRAIERKKYPYCDRYANDALRQHADALRGRCNLTGARWQSNKDAHFKWCLNSADPQIEFERNERNRLLSQCLSPRSNYIPPPPVIVGGGRAGGGNSSGGAGTSPGVGNAQMCARATEACVPNNRQGTHCCDDSLLCVYQTCRACVKSGEDCARGGTQLCCNQGETCVLDTNSIATGKVRTICGIPG